MDIFTIIIDSTVHGFWGWRVLGMLVLLTTVLGFCSFLAHTLDGPRWILQGFGILAFASVSWGVISWGSWEAATEETRENRIAEALLERGINDPVEIDEGIYVLTRDGDAAIFTTLSQGEHITFYQTTE